MSKPLLCVVCIDALDSYVVTADRTYEVRAIKPGFIRVAGQPMWLKAARFRPATPDETYDYWHMQSLSPLPGPWQHYNAGDPMPSEETLIDFYDNDGRFWVLMVPASADWGWTIVRWRYSYASDIPIKEESSMSEFKQYDVVRCIAPSHVGCVGIVGNEYVIEEISPNGSLSFRPTGDHGIHGFCDNARFVPTGVNIPPEYGQSSDATHETLEIIRKAACPHLPADAKARKAIPMATGLLDYFPDALAAVAALSQRATDQHHPGEPVHWDRNTSADEADTLMRHFLDRGTVDTDGQRHSTKVAWRALALLQKELEADRAAG